MANFVSKCEGILLVARSMNGWGFRIGVRVQGEVWPIGRRVSEVVRRGVG